MTFFEVETLTTRLPFPTLASLGLDETPGQEGWHRGGERSDPTSVTGWWITQKIQILSVTTHNTKHS